MNDRPVDFDILIGEIAFWNSLEWQANFYKYVVKKDLLKKKYGLCSLNKLIYESKPIDMYVLEISKNI